MGTIKIHLEYNETKIDFEGSSEEVIKVLLDFLAKHYPAYNLVKNLTITIDFEELLKKLKGVIGFAPEGAIVTIPKEKISKLEPSGDTTPIPVITILRIFIAHYLTVLLMYILRKKPKRCHAPSSVLSFISC